MTKIYSIPLAAVAAFALGTAYAKAPPATPPAQVQVTFDELKFAPLGDRGAQLAAVFGDAKIGPFGVLIKAPAGYESPMHYHDSDYRGIVLKGTVINVEQGDEASSKSLTQGSTWYQSGKRLHVTKCASGSDCLWYSHMTGPYTALGPDGKPLGAARTPH